MQYKFLITLLFSTLALAAPAPQSDSSVSNSSESDSSEPNSAVALPSIPHSIYTVMVTAVPASWYEELQNPVSRSSMISEIQAGTMPAWYNRLPASVKAWASSAGGIGANLVAATATAPAGAGSGSGSQSLSTSTPIATTTGSPSSTHSSSSSTGGAPVTTGGVAMSLAGAAGLLGLAIAL